MSYAEAQYIIDELGERVNTSLIRIYTTDLTLAGQTVTATKNGTEIGSAIIDSSGVAKIYTEESGKIKLTLSDTAGVYYTTITHYATYYVRVYGTEVYGFRVLKAGSVPSSRVEYLENVLNTDYEPVYMDFETGKFNYGDWSDAFFMQVKPCMLTFAGEVDYYLDPDDYGLKEDGETASDVADTSYNGNAMIEWPKIWYYVYEEDGYEYYYISNVQVDENYQCWSNHDINGNEIDHFYTPIYDGSVVSSIMRSMSGLTPSNTLAGTTQLTYCKANNQTDDEIWNSEVWADVSLIVMLLKLIGKSTDGQETFGYGHYTGGSAASSLIKSGTLDQKGLFWGSNSTGLGVKVFGMENFWGNLFRMCTGLMASAKVIYAKMTYGQEDGTSVTGYNTTAVTGYHQLVTVSGTTGGYISETYASMFGTVQQTISGSSDTYECDGAWFTTSGVAYARFGGDCSFGLLCGPSAVHLRQALSTSSWDCGASVSCKPLAS